MPTVQINDIEIYYEQHGHGEPLLLITGLSADHTAWLNVLDGLSVNFQVTIFDNRGAGMTSCPDKPYTTEQMADDTAGLMQALNIDKAHIIGHSMGSCIAQQLAIRHPEKINKLILYASAAKLDPRSLYILQERIRLWEKHYPNEDIYRSILIPWGYSKHFLNSPENIEQVLELLKINKASITLTGYKHQLAALSHHDTLTLLSQIHTATLVLSMSEDILTTPTDGRYLAAHIDNAEYHEVDAQAHVFHFEAPQAFIDIVIQFL